MFCALASDYPEQSPPFVIENRRVVLLDDFDETEKRTQRRLQIVRDGIGERLEILVDLLKGAICHTQCFPGGDKLPILFDGRLVGRQKEINGAARLGAHQIVVVREMDADTGGNFRRPTEFHIRNQVTESRDQISAVERLADEIVRAGRQPPDDLLRVGERGNENHRQILCGLARPDPPAQLITAHNRHHHVGQYNVRPTLLEAPQRRLTVGR